MPFTYILIAFMLQWLSKVAAIKHMALKAQNIYYLTLYGKTVLTSGLKPVSPPKGPRAL